MLEMLGTRIHALAVERSQFGASHQRNPSGLQKSPSPADLENPSTMQPLTRSPSPEDEEEDLVARLQAVRARKVESLERLERLEKERQERESSKA